MKYPSNTAIAYSDSAKEAALYFDFVIFMMATILSPRVFLPGEKTNLFEISEKLFPKYLGDRCINRYHEHVAKWAVWNHLYLGLTEDARNNLNNEVFKKREELDFASDKINFLSGSKKKRAEQLLLKMRENQKDLEATLNRKTISALHLLSILEQEEFESYPNNSLDDEYSILEWLKTITIEKLIAQLHKFITTFHLSRYPWVLSENPIDDRSKPITVHEDIMVTLAGLKLVDLSKTTWDHIFEFRKKTESKNKLRRLRLFIYNNYSGKDATFIEDDILQRLDEYNDVIAEWGFDTITSSLSALVSSKSMLAASTAAFLSILLGQQQALKASLIGGASIECGKLIIQLAKKKFELHKLAKEFPLHYIFDASKVLTKNDQNR